MAAVTATLVALAYDDPVRLMAGDPAIDQLMNELREVAGL